MITIDDLVGVTVIDDVVYACVPSDLPSSLMCVIHDGRRIKARDSVYRDELAEMMIGLRNPLEGVSIDLETGDLVSCDEDRVCRSVDEHPFIKSLIAGRMLITALKVMRALEETEWYVPEHVVVYIRSFE